MTEYILRRLAYFVAVLFLVTMVTFSVALLLPGDPALAYIGEANMRDKAMYETMRKELGLDQPIPVQYAKWLGRRLPPTGLARSRSRPPDAAEGCLDDGRVGPIVGALRPGRAGTVPAFD